MPFRCPGSSAVQNMNAGGAGGWSLSPAGGAGGGRLAPPPGRRGGRALAGGGRGGGGIMRPPRGGRGGGAVDQDLEIGPAGEAVERIAGIRLGRDRPGRGGSREVATGGEADDPEPIRCDVELVGV